MAGRPLSESDFPEGDLWVFGYGSLMWRPGFDYAEEVPAQLIGEHRALCVLSHIHRGTPEHPGLVLGLDRGGACMGTAFRVAKATRNDTLTYLRGREQVTGVYREVMRSVWIEGDARRRVRALTYVADRSHPQYAGSLSIDEQFLYVATSQGKSGTNREYVISTVKALEARGCRDPELHHLAALLQGDTPMHR